MFIVWANLTERIYELLRVHYREKVLFSSLSVQYRMKIVEWKLMSKHVCWDVNSSLLVDSHICAMLSGCQDQNKDRTSWLCSVFYNATLVMPSRGN